MVPAGTITLQGFELDVTKSLTITGAGAGATTISGGTTTRVFGVGNTGTDLTLAQLSVRDGLVNSPGSLASGGGMSIGSGASVDLKHVAFTNNVAQADGLGGIAEGGAIYSSGSVTIEASSFTDNAVLARGTAGVHGGVASGGAIQANPAVSLSITQSNISGNRAIATGGTGMTDGGSAQGGGITALGPLALTDSTVSANLADASAGSGGTASSGARGAGVDVQPSSGNTAEISGSTIAGNIARADVASGPGPAGGGGLVTVVPSDATLTVNSSTLAGNAATHGGNVDPAGTGAQRMGNTIVAGGSGLVGQENCADPMISLGHNLDSLDQCGFSATGDRRNTDPKLQALGNNGGPGPTLGFGTDSPAFDTGDSATCPAADERGIKRPQGGGCDIGAFELELADLGLRGSASASRLKLGAKVTFTLSASNGGSGTGHSTAINATLPVGLVLVSTVPSPGSCAGTHSLACVFGDLGAGGASGVQVVARAIKPGSQTMNASIASSTVDLVGANNAVGLSVAVGKLNFSAARLSRRTFRRGSKLPKLSRVRTGTTIRFTLPEAARVKFSFARKRGRRFRSAGAFTRRAHAGKNRLRFQGRLSRHKKLKPGRYRLTLRATDQFGNRSPVKRLRFRLLP